MLRVHHRKILPGDIANISIGQGDILITPLQMAQLSGIVAAEGKFHQTRLIKQIQGPDNTVIAAYPDRLRADLQIKPEVISTLREAMIDVTEDAQGTAHRAQVEGIHVAGKTGTAQWGPQNKQRTAAWFTALGSAIEFLILGSVIEYLALRAATGDRQHINFVIEGMFYGKKHPH